MYVPRNLYKQNIEVTHYMQCSSGTSRIEGMYYAQVYIYAKVFCSGILFYGACLRDRADVLYYPCSIAHVEE